MPRQDAHNRSQRRPRGSLQNLQSFLRDKIVLLYVLLPESGFMHIKVKISELRAQLRRISAIC